MKILKKSDFQIMENLFSLTEEQLKITVGKFLKTKYENVVETEDYVYAIGDIPVALVAHLDTVWETPPKELFYDAQKGVIFTPGGMGADDRAGVYAIIQIIRSGLRPHVIFTTAEESGCIGAGFLSRIDCPFENLNFLIELDRRGECDCVFYDCENQAFTDYISKFGFIESYGTFSDICELCPSWGVAGVNLSVGYKNEHTSSEILYTNPLLATIEKVKNILKDTSITEPFKYIPSTSWYYNNYYSAAMGSGYKGGGLESFCRCAKCNGLAYKDETIDVIMLDGKIGQVCYDCLTKEVDWCSRCHKAYEVKDTCKNFVCDECLAAEKEKKGKQK